MWFPTRVPCRRCHRLCTLGALGWSIYLLINLGGIALIGASLLLVRQGALAPHRALAAGIAVSMLAPFVWVSAVRVLPTRAAPPGRAPGRTA